jgi:hypothetical protein
VKFEVTPIYLTPEDLAQAETLQRMHQEIMDRLREACHIPIGWLSGLECDRRSSMVTFHFQFNPAFYEAANIEPPASTKPRDFCPYCDRFHEAEFVDELNATIMACRERWLESEGDAR